MLKKVVIPITFFLFAIICFSSNVIASGETAYNSIINSYIDYYESNGQEKTLPDDYYFNSLKSSTTPEFDWMELGYFGYNLKDLNNDGTKELIVGTCASDDVAVTLSDAYLPVIEAIITLDGGQPKLVTNNINTNSPWDANINSKYITLLNNNIVIKGTYKPYKPENKPEGCWSTHYEIYTLSTDGNLVLEKAYIDDLHADKQGMDYYLIENGVEKPISQEEYDAVVNNSESTGIPLKSFKERNPLGNSTPNQQPSNPSNSSSNGIDVFRLYNKLTGEHLYTTDENEANTLSQGDWNNEGVGWKSAKTGEPVYRLYCEVTKTHLFTNDQNEINSLKASGLWNVDNNSNPVFYSGGSKPIYRLYNESLKMHLLTTNEGEYNSLASQGWNQEGSKFNCQ